MADLPAAIAAAREALAYYEGLAECNADYDPCAHEITGKLSDLLSALDAAQGEAVLFVKAEQLADHRVSGMNAVRAGHQDHARGLHTVPLYLAPQAPPAAIAAAREAVAEVERIKAEYKEEPFIKAFVLTDLLDALDAAQPAPRAAVPAANVTPMRQPRADLARLVESINAAVYANGDGLSVTEAIGALELAKLELLKEQEQ